VKLKALNERIEDEARKTFMALHRNRRNGYDRGYCHCQTCDEKIQELIGHFTANGAIVNIGPGRWAIVVRRVPVDGVSPRDAVEVVRTIATERGWI